MNAESRAVVSVRVAAGARTLCVELNENSDASTFLSISEIGPGDHGVRSRILIDGQYVHELMRALRAVREFIGSEPERKSYSVEEKRRVHPRAYEPWTDDEHRRLEDGFARGDSVNQLAREHGRGPSAIKRRLERLGLC